MTQIITAWRLHDGVAVYLDAERRWVENLAQARIWAAEEVDATLGWTRSPEQERVVCDPYLVPVDADGSFTKRRAREVIRSRGPTVRPDLQRR